MTSTSAATRWVPFGWRRNAAGDEVLDWCDLGGERLSEPFFDQSIQRRLATPGRYRVTPLSALETLAPDRWANPLGLVFHVSRCGSTLVTRMLSAVARFAALSEPAIVEAVLRPPGKEEPADARVRRLRGVIHALAGHPGGAELCVVKLASRATEDIACFEAALPQARWVFLYRHPLEVLAAQVGSEPRDSLPPGVAEAGLLPGNSETLRSMRPAEFWARVFARRCETALAALDSGRGGLLHYDDLPAAAWRSLVPHFGARCAPSDIESMQRASAANAKRPADAFTPDAVARRRGATNEVRAAAERFAMPGYEALESRRRLR